MLTPNWGYEHTDEFGEDEDFTQGPGSLHVLSAVFRTRSWEVTLWEERTLSNARHQAVRREEEDWEVPTLYAPPLKHNLTIYSNAYVPGVCIGGRTSALVKMEEHVEVFKMTGLFKNGPLSSVKQRWCWVVYDTTPAYYLLDAEGKAVLAADGKKVPLAAESKIIVDSGRTWDQATRDGTVVKETDAPQVAIWKLVETEVVKVKREYDRWRKTTVRVDHLTDDWSSNTENIPIDGISYEYPLNLAPPLLEAAPNGTAGVRLEMRGGGSERRIVYPVPLAEDIPPDRYRVYRRTVTAPASRTYTGDPYGLHTTPPAHTSRIPPIPQDTAITDPSGAPVSAVPSATAYTEPDDQTSPDHEYWEQIGEVEPEPGIGGAALMDATVEDGGVYEYHAMAVIGETESDPSSPARVSYNGGRTQSSGIVVKVRATSDGAIEGDARAPDPEDFGAEYGEVAIVALPADPEDLDEAADITLALAQERFAASQPRGRVTLRPSFLPLGLARGMRAKVGEMLWRSFKGGVRVDSGAPSAEWMIQGFKGGASRQDGKLVVDFGEITLDEIR